jgi:hypothetical protein
MLLNMKCTCGKLLDVDEVQLGKAAECPWCGNRITASAAVHSMAAVQAAQPKRDEREAAELWRVPRFFWILGAACLAICALVAIMLLTHMPTPTDVAEAQIKGPLTLACNAYYVRVGAYPPTLGALLGPPTLLDRDQLIDPWGRPYRYDPKGPKNNGMYPDIWTVTPDGIEIGNWPTAR